MKLCVRNAHSGSGYTEIISEQTKIEFQFAVLHRIFVHHQWSADESFPPENVLPYYQTAALPPHPLRRFP